MATVELLFRVGDAAGYPADPNAGRDGALLAIANRGYWWDTPVVQDYLDTSTTPPSWLQISKFKRQTIRRAFDRVRWATEPGRTPQEVADIRDPGWDTLPIEDQTTLLAEYSAWIGRASGWLFQLQTYGYDTNWNIGELRNFGVMCTDMIDTEILQYQETIEQRPLKLNLHPAEKTQRKAKQWYRVQYENFLNPAQIANIADTSQVVKVTNAKRNNPIDLLTNIQEF